MDLKGLAQLGAAQRVAEIEAELAAIRKAFPSVVGRRRVESGSGGGTFVPGDGKKRRGRPPMSAAQRKAVGIRMKAYWAKRRLAKR